VLPLCRNKIYALTLYTKIVTTRHVHQINRPLRASTGARDHVTTMTSRRRGLGAAHQRQYDEYSGYHSQYGAYCLERGTVDMGVMRLCNSDACYDQESCTKHIGQTLLQDAPENTYYTRNS